MSISRKTFPLLAALLTALLIVPAAANAAPAAAPHMQVVPGDPSSSTYFRFYTSISNDTAQCRVADDASAPWTVCQDDFGNGSFEPQLADGQHTVEISEVDNAGTLAGLQLHLDARHRRPRARDDHQRPGRDHDQHHRDVRVHLRAGRLLHLRPRRQCRDAVQR